MSNVRVFLSCHLLAGMGLCPSLPRGKTVRAVCGVSEALTRFGPLEMTASDILSFSESIVALFFSIKSMPIKPAALVGSEHKMGA